MSGEAAEAIEKVPAGEAVAEAMTVLRGIFEPQGISVPTPLQVSFTAFTAADTVPCHCTRFMCQGWHVMLYYGGSMQHAKQGRLYCFCDVHQTDPSFVMGIS